MESVAPKQHTHQRVQVQDNFDDDDEEERVYCLSQ